MFAPIFSIDAGDSIGNSFVNDHPRHRLAVFFLLWGVQAVRLGVHRDAVNRMLNLEIL
jgi:hypothetical protein